MIINMFTTSSSFNPLRENAAKGKGSSASLSSRALRDASTLLYSSCDVHRLTRLVRDARWQCSFWGVECFRGARRRNSNSNSRTCPDAEACRAARIVAHAVVHLSATRCRGRVAGAVATAGPPRAVHVMSSRLSAAPVYEYVECVGHQRALHSSRRQTATRYSQALSVLVRIHNCYSHYLTWSNSSRPPGCFISPDWQAFFSHLSQCPISASPSVSPSALTSLTRHSHVITQSTCTR